MLVKIGERDLEFGKELGELRDSNALLDQPDALRARLADDGYLLIRGLQDRAAVLEARRAIFEFMRDNGNQILDGTDLMDGLINPDTKPARLLGNKAITHHPPVRAVMESKAIFDFFERLFGEPALTFDYKWLRQVGTSEFTGAHYDNVYMGRGSKRLHTCWTPYGDIPMEQGTLAVCVGSHKLDGFAKLRETYGNMDVDRDHVTGWFTGDPLEITNKFGGQWQTTNFRAGDVLVITMFTMHGSTNNTTDRWRLSCDTRFQPASDPVDERWVGESPMAHYAWTKGEVKPMAVARAEWGV
ncbi:MAG: phytanoyl-CoA dioxygenase family protein [Verrucomicrobia bacterium]|nr:phytanoyl-CoA dioxygenase family protein [Verrucomicrobiota bacterium]